MDGSGAPALRSFHLYAHHEIPVKRSSLLLIGLLLAACGSAPPPKPPTPKPLPVRVASPVDVSAPESLAARLPAGDGGQMLLRFTVDAAGAVRDANVVMSQLPGDDTAAMLAAFSGLRFRPWREAGKPVAQEFIYPLFFGTDAVAQRTQFFCRHQQDLYLPASRCDILPQGGFRLYRITPPYPASAPAGTSGSVTLSFDVDASGVPSDVKVLKSTPPGVFDSAAVLAVEQWYLEPLGSTPVTGTQHATVTVTFVPPASPAGGP